MDNDSVQTYRRLNISAKMQPTLHRSTGVA